MTKDEKRRIRTMVIQILDQYCRSCEFFSVELASIRACRQCPHGKRMQELSRPLWRQDEAGPGGKTGRWTEEEDFYILHHYGVQPIEVLSARTGRSIQAIRKRIETLKGGEPA
ncbi:hypothetical protein P9848_00860 [Geobacillus stearothermophilus]|uniref:hypothetical protein n=1 Tax=Geobacillus stearothermophilus TaxID=1422 RepID=UPI002E2045C7|nr:hypothetical protein [Geobacillus stearothermophilus]